MAKILVMWLVPTNSDSAKNKKDSTTTPFCRTMFEWEAEDGERHHYRVGVDATVSDCKTLGTSSIPEPCLDDSHISSTNIPLVRNVLGEDLYSYMRDIFIDSKDLKQLTEIEQCNLVHKLRYEKDLSDRFVFGTIGVILVLTFSVLIFILLLKTLAMKRRKKLRNVDAKTELISKDGIAPNMAEEIQNVPAVQGCSSSTKLNEDISEPVSIPEKEVAQYSGIPLSYQLNVSNFHSQIQVKSLDSVNFLCNTIDKLYSELDKLLLKNATNDRSTAQLALSTPRLARRNDRRGRVGSSPSLTMVDQQTTPDEQNSNTREKYEAWNELKIFARGMNWLETHTVNIDVAKLDRPGQRLLHYFHRVCPINNDQWDASVLLTNFALLLLNKELKGLKSKIGYKCIALKATGSAKNGSKVCKPNQFDIFMEMHPPDDIVPTSIIEQAKVECIPPGRFLVTAKLRERSVHVSSTMVSKTMKKIELEGIVPQLCLSSKEMTRSAEELTESCLQTLYTKHRSIVDRLPFQIKRAVVPNLVVSLDTKNLVRLGIPEIKLNLIPVMVLPFEGWYQPMKIYATSLMEAHEYKHKPETSNAICPDYFWQVAFGDVNEVFQSCLNDRMRYAGIDSCHTLCLMILKSLLTGGVKSSLLDRGEYQTLHISTCLNFLLLESQPEQWRYDQLVNRFSDCIHFLRDSFTNGRLPNFFINNPYLSEKMPFIRSLPLLMRKRQENLLSDMRTEALEKCVRFLEESLRESGLAECVKDDYSHDMWEYEFFVFN